MVAVAFRASVQEGAGNVEAVLRGGESGNADDYAEWADEAGTRSSMNLLAKSGIEH